MNQILPISVSRASTRSRYPGTRPFSESPEDQQRFFGRHREGQQLYLRVLSVPVLLQFAKSGLGKTSLLQASLFPRLREKPFLPVMVRFNEKNESPVDAVARSIRQACRTEQLQVPEFRTEGIWELLSTALVWRDDLLLTPVLVLDQFEEVFTVHDRAFRDALASELGALATRVPPERTGLSEASDSEPPPTPPDVKILISLREDYLGALEEFSPAIPNLFHERLRLGPLSEEGAREAVTSPAQLVAQSGGEAFWAPLFEFEESTLDEMITFLKGEAGVIEPFTLQLICRRAESIAHDKGRKGNSLRSSRSPISRTEGTSVRSSRISIRKPWSDWNTGWGMRRATASRNSASTACSIANRAAGSFWKSVRSRTSSGSMTERSTSWSRSAWSAASVGGRAHFTRSATIVSRNQSMRRGETSVRRKSVTKGEKKKN